MPVAISMPRLGMTMEEGTIVDWPRAVGDAVAKGDVVLVIESEKSEVEVEAAGSGFLRHVYVEVGETVPCGALLGAITATRDEPFDADAFHAAEDRAEARPGGRLEVRTGAAAPPAPARRDAPPVAPAARAAARKLGIDPGAVPGTGPGGRVTKEDVERWAASREALVPVADGVGLEVRSEGEGDLVVLLPGLGTDVSVFARQTPALAERFAVRGINPRGVGLSDAPEADAYEVAQTAADAAAAFEGAAHVVGASLGAAAALELAFAHPERVRSLVLITPFVEAGPRLRAVGDAWCRLAAEATPETVAAALLPWFFSARYLDDEGARPRTLRGLARTVSKVPAATLERTTEGMARWSGSRADELARVSMPTLVVGAGDDLLTPGAEAIAEAIPGATLRMIDGAGHAVALEASEAVNDAIAAHLA
jgi:pyruvate/2-oxoglutarate dehydrogenase complex dihydrolipoamide acyltransferase (E2) component